jgi:transcriptional regulator GlxA family with amidase domain
MEPRRVVIVVYDQVLALDAVGPAEVLASASLARPPGYRVELVAAAEGPVRTSAGYDLVPHRSLQNCRGPIDTLIVAGGPGSPAAEKDGELIRWIAAAAHRSRRVASVCTGAFVLARAGLLDGRRVTTHWASCGRLARQHPRAVVEPYSIFVRDGDVFTSAGVTAGMDLTLALVEDDLGRDVALQVARALVMFTRRGGGQSQFSAALRALPAQREPLRELQDWMLDHLDADLSVPALAERAFMSPRNFARAFRAETGLTPAAYVRQLRTEAARSQLEAGDLPIEIVAKRCGFGTIEAMRRAFHDSLGVGPAAYRARFRSTWAA